VYAAAYTFGRFFTEYERIDFAHKIGPLRLNDWTSIVVFVVSVTVLVIMNRPRPEALEVPTPGAVAEPDPVSDPR
jgi:prolipoprotein diacylglyceryltransferase